jgi:hypothetical protein
MNVTCWAHIGGQEGKLSTSVQIAFSSFLKKYTHAMPYWQLGTNGAILAKAPNRELLIYGIKVT